MKLQLAIVIGAILVGSIATVNMAFVQNNEFSANSLKSTAGILGHITLTATDKDGNIIAYRQTDNVVTNLGDDCILEKVFGDGITGTCLTSASLFTDVHIGTADGISFTEGSSSLGTWFAGTGGAVGTTLSASGLSGASTIVTAQFFSVGTAIEEAALQGGPQSNSNILALQKFATINLGASDDLTIAWTVAIDGQ